MAAVAMAGLMTAFSIPAAATASPAPATGRGDSAPYGAPSPGALSLLRRQVGPTDWLVVTTPEARHRVRAGRIGEAGLEDVRVHSGEAPHAPLAWSRIARIERRTSHFRAGQVLGAIAGATALGYAGAAIGEAGGSRRTSHNDAGAWTGIGIGAVAGAWLGGSLGDRVTRETTLYVGVPEGVPMRVAAVIAPDRAIDVARVRAALAPDDLLRVRGSFGERIGRAGAVGDDGLRGFLPDPAFDAGDAAPEPIRWETVSGIQRRGSGARRGALIGGTILGLGVGTFAAAVSAGGVGLSSGGDAADVIGAFAGGAVGGGLLGAGLGALVGRNFEIWHDVPGIPEPVAGGAGAP